MASEQYIKEYAAAILAHKDGYSLEKVLRLFPRYFAAIANYMNFLLLEQQKKELSDRLFIDYNILRGEWKELDVCVKEYDKIQKQIESIEQQDPHAFDFGAGAALDLKCISLQLNVAQQAQTVLKKKLELNTYYGLYNDQVSQLNNKLNYYINLENETTKIFNIVVEQYFTGGNNA